MTTIPKTVEEAVNWLIGAMTLNDRIRVARVQEEELRFLNLGLGTYIEHKFELSTRNTDLLQSCKAESGMEVLCEDSAATVIIRELGERLCESHRIRAVK
jgi:hypothetical protein